MIDWIIQQIDELKKKIRHLEGIEQPRWIYLSTPLTGTGWEGSAYSTTAKTLIDLSTVFLVPAGVKAVYVWFQLNDSGSAGGDYWLILSNNNTANSGLAFNCPRSGNDHVERKSAVIPCDVSGDIFFQISASGVGTMDIYLRVFAYLI